MRSIVSILIAMSVPLAAIVNMTAAGILFLLLIVWLGITTPQ